MKTVEIPDFGRLEMAHLVCDYNGTLAVDGILLPGVAEAMNALEGIQVHVITADTFGLARKQLENTRCHLVIAPEENQAQWKLEYITTLGAETVVAVGNGRNDALMLERARLGIALLQREGAARETLMQADIVCSSALHALEYFTHPKRLVATLRS